MSEAHEFSALQVALFAANLTRSCERVALRIAWRQGGSDGWCTLTIPQLAADCHVGAASVKRALKALDDAGWLETADAGTSSGGRPAKMRRVVDPGSGSPRVSRNVSAHPGRAETLEGTAAVLAHSERSETAEVSAHSRGSFGSSEGEFRLIQGGVSAHPGRAPQEPRSLQEGKPRAGAEADAHTGEGARDGWLARSLAALWSGWRERYRARIGPSVPEEHLEQLRPLAAWVVQQAADRDVKPEDVAEMVLVGFWLRDVRKPEATWMGEAPLRYLVAAEEAARTEERERRQAEQAALERQRELDLNRAVVGPPPDALEWPARERLGPVRAVREEREARQERHQERRMVLAEQAAALRATAQAGGS